MGLCSLTPRPRCLGFPHAAPRDPWPSVRPSVRPCPDAGAPSWCRFSRAPARSVAICLICLLSGLRWSCRHQEGRRGSDEVVRRARALPRGSRRPRPSTLAHCHLHLASCVGASVPDAGPLSPRPGAAASAPFSGGSLRPGPGVTMRSVLLPEPAPPAVNRAPNPPTPGAWSRRDTHRRPGICEDVGSYSSKSLEK